MFSKEIFEYAVLMRREELKNLENKLQGMLVLGENLSDYVLLEHARNGFVIKTEIVHKTDIRLRETTNAQP